MSWHIPEEQLLGYACGGLGGPEAWSVESHLAACPACAARLGAAARAGSLAPRVSDVRERVMMVAREEAASRLRVGSGPASSWTRAWRLLAAAPALRLPWIAAAVFTTACATLLGVVSDGGHPHASPVLLLIAPLLPLAGVAVSYGPGTDPAYELTLATPFSGFRLLLVRTVTVLGVTVPLLLAAAFAVPTAGVGAAAWLLPALALVLVTLTLGGWVDQRLAAGLVGAGWAAAVALPRALPATAAPDVFDPAVQPAWAAVAVLAAGFLVARRGAYERMEG